MKLITKIHLRLDKFYFDSTWSQGTCWKFLYRLDSTYNFQNRLDLQLWCRIVQPPQYLLRLLNLHLKIWNPVLNSFPKFDFRTSCRFVDLYKWKMIRFDYYKLSKLPQKYLQHFRQSFKNDFGYTFLNTNLIHDLQRADLNDLRSSSRRDVVSPISRNVASSCLCHAA